MSKYYFAVIPVFSNLSNQFYVLIYLEWGVIAITAPHKFIFSSS